MRETFPPATFVENFSGVRSHHWINYAAIIRSIERGYVRSLSLWPIEEAQAIADVRRDAWNKLEEQYGRDPKNYTFREDFDKSWDDDSSPLHLPEDYIGNDPDSFARRLATDTIAFLTDPDDLEIPIGLIKDGMCRACVFGIHCDKFYVEGEEKDLGELYVLIQEYLETDYAQEAKKQHPERYTFTASGVRREEKQMLVHHMRMRLGLLRDALTWRESNPTIFTYRDLLIARGLV